jgi:hypothetical protein
MSATQQAVAAAMATGGPNPGAPPDIFLPGQTPADTQWLVANVAGLASTAPNGQSQIQVDAGYDFYWLATTYFADIAGAAVTNSSLVVPVVLLLWNDSSASRNLMNNPIPLNSIASPDAAEPYRLIRPRLYPANTVITFTWTAYVASGTTYANIYLTLHGYRIRKLGA